MRADSEEYRVETSLVLRFEHALLLDEIKAKSDAEIADATLEHQRNLAELRREKQELRADELQALGAFEADSVAAVPEPSAWALMIAGFGLAGAAMRRARGAVAA